jgi:hypothetical protein
MAAASPGPAATAVLLFTDEKEVSPAKSSDRAIGIALVTFKTL